MISVDLVKSTVVIKKIISVLPETKVTKGDATLKLSDLKVGDKVTVKCATDVLGKEKADSITVETK